MMRAGLRFLLGLLLLPACWAAAVAFVTVLSEAGTLSVGSLAFVGGLLVFGVCWFALPHPVKTYVLGHELTHALWGLLFGAIPSRLRVSARGGSVDLSKSNLLITLAPYFFPFYTFLILLAAALVACWIHPLPWLPLWLFLIGFTWAFHLLFTVDSLALVQPDVTLYGRVFSWAFILLANLILVLIGLGLATDFGLIATARVLFRTCADAYAGCWHIVAQLIAFCRST